MPTPVVPLPDDSSPLRTSDDHPRNTSKQTNPRGIAGNKTTDSFDFGSTSPSSLPDHTKGDHTTTTGTADGITGPLHTDYTRPPIHTNSQHHAGQRLALPISIVAFVSPPTFLPTGSSIPAPPLQTNIFKECPTFWHPRHPGDHHPNRPHPSTCHSSTGPVTSDGPVPYRNPFQTTPDWIPAYVGLSNRPHYYRTSTRSAPTIREITGLISDLQPATRQWFQQLPSHCQLHTNRAT